MDFAKSGFVAQETVTLPAGPLTDFSFSMEPQLRALGLPTQLEKGIIVLREDHIVCRAGTHLTPEQAQLLKLFGKPMAEFKITLLCMWTKDDGSFEKIKITDELQKNKPSKLLERSQTEMDYSEIKNRSAKDTSNNRTSMDLTELNAKLEESTKQDSKSGVANKSPNQEKKSADHSTKSFVDEITANNFTDFLVKKEEFSRQSNKQENNHPIKQDSTTPKQTPKKSTKTPKNKATQEKNQTPLRIEKPKSEEVSEKEEEAMQGRQSSKLDVGTPRRSMRTPKPIKRTPEQQKMSVKKLTESSKTITPKQTKPTPKRQSMRKTKPQMESEDVEMTD